MYNLFLLLAESRLKIEGTKESLPLKIRKVYDEQYPPIPKPPKREKKKPKPKRDEYEDDYEEKGAKKKPKHDMEAKKKDECKTQTTVRKPKKTLIEILENE